MYQMDETRVFVKRSMGQFWDSSGHTTGDAQILHTASYVSNGWKSSLRQGNQMFWEGLGHAAADADILNSTIIIIG